MTTDPIAAAIDHIRRITPQNDPWTGQDVADGTNGGDPLDIDYDIATILNAVVSGQLINRASRDEMLAQVRRGEGFTTAGAAARWITDSEAGVYDTDAPDPIAAARALLDKVPPLFIDLDGDLCREGDGYNLVGCAATDDEPPFGPLNPAIWSAIPALRDTVATLADAVEAERAKVAAAFAMQDAGYSITTPADAQAALDKLLAEARLEGWRAGRDAAADEARSCTHDPYVVRAIRALPEPKETSHD